MSVFESNVPDEYKFDQPEVIPQSGWRSQYANPILPGESFEGTPSLYRPNLRNLPQWPGEQPGLMFAPFNPDAPDSQSLFIPAGDRESMTHSTPEPPLPYMHPNVPHDAAAILERLTQPLLPRSIAEELASLLPGNHTPESIQQSADMASMVGIAKINLPKEVLQALASQGKNVDQMAAELGVGRKTIMGQLKEHGIQGKPQGGQQAPIDWSEFARLREQGVPFEDIGQRLGITGRTLHSARAREGYRIGNYTTPRPDEPRILEDLSSGTFKGGSGHFVPEQAIERMRQLRAEGKTTSEVAGILGTKPDTIAARVTNYGLGKEVPSPQMLNARDQKLLDMLDKGSTYSEIADEFGLVSRNAVAGRVDRVRRRQAGISTSKPLPERGEPIQMTSPRATPSLPQVNKPPPEELDPAEIAKYMRIFGHE